MDHPLFGLLLVGGASRRMGRDKALLSYTDGGTQLDRSTQLLRAVCQRVFVSQRAEQAFPLPPGATSIYDSVTDIQGPLCGILSAMAAHPEAHWLVLACDLPHLKIATLEKLVRHFNESPPHLTAYRSSHDDLPEPLCAIYPAGSADDLAALAQKLGKNCPRKLLIEKKARLIDQDDPRSLDNINTVEEYEAARRNL